MARQLSAQLSDLCSLAPQCHCGNSKDSCCLPAAGKLKVGIAGLHMQGVRQLSGLRICLSGAHMDVATHGAPHRGIV